MAALELQAGAADLRHWLRAAWLSLVEVAIPTR